MEMEGEMEGEMEANTHLRQLESEAADAHYVWQYFFVSKYSEAKKDRPKNSLCMFCDKVFSACIIRCITARATARAAKAVIFAK
jgi:hypothetical protein